MFVYIITNRENGKIYIGKTIKSNLKPYLRHKIWSALTGRYSGRSHLFNAMQKYNSSSWSIHPIISNLTTNWQLCLWEKALIYAFDSTNPEIGYNICKGGQGYIETYPSHLTSPETIEKLKVTRANQDESYRLKAFNEWKNQKLIIDPDHFKRIGAVASKEDKRKAGRMASREAKQRAGRRGAAHGGIKARHTRWHINAGKPNPHCPLCTGYVGETQCAFCGRPAVAILEKSGLACCKVRANKCPSPRLLPCYGCGKPSVALNKFGPVCCNPCPELDRLQKEKGKKTMTEKYGESSPALHARWHVNREQINPECPLCNPSL